MNLPREALLVFLLATTSSVCDAFVPSSTKGRRPSFFAGSSAVAAESTAETAEALLQVQASKPTGTSFLPEEAIERAKKGSPIEKIKLAKDGTSAFVDVYEYARKIREGEMTWEEVEKADLDTVST